MLCNGILKRRAGTAPISLHDTLCIFDRKVGTPFPPYGEALIFFDASPKGEEGVTHFSAKIHNVSCNKIGAVPARLFKIPLHSMNSDMNIT